MTEIIIIVFLLLISAYFLQKILDKHSDQIQNLEERIQALEKFDPELRETFTAI